jgi:hypothetical protein
LTLIRIFEELRGRGYDGGYDAVRRYARRWAKQHGQAIAAAYVPLSFAPGEAYQLNCFESRLGFGRRHYGLVERLVIYAPAAFCLWLGHTHRHTLLDILLVIFAGNAELAQLFAPRGTPGSAISRSMPFR